MKNGLFYFKTRNSDAMARMVPIEIIPKGRGKEDKIIYKFMRWLVRKNRKKISQDIQQMQHDLMVYGQYATKDGKVIRMSDILTNSTKDKGNE